MKRLYRKPTIRTCRVEDSEPLLAASETPRTMHDSLDINDVPEDEQPHTTNYDKSGGDGSGNYDF